MTDARVGPSRAALIMFSLAGLAAAAWLWQAVPARDAALRDRTLSRAGMVERACSIARDFGLNTDGWSAAVRLTRDRRPETRLVEASSDSSGSPLRRPSVAVEVFLIAPPRGASEHVRAHLHFTQDGRLLDWNLEGLQDEDSPSDLTDDAVSRLPAAPKPVDPASLIARAEQRLAGGATPLFHRLNADSVKADGSYEFECHDPSNGALNWRIHTSLKHGLLVKAELDPDVMDGSFFSTFHWRFTTTDLRVVGFVVFLIIAVGATLSGLLAWRLGNLDRRLLATAFGLLIVASAGSWMWGLAHDEFVASASADGLVGLILKETLILAWCAWMLAAAEARAQRFATASWAPLRMLLCGRLADGNVLRAIAAGLGAGAIIAVCRVAPEWLGAPEPFWRALGLGGLSASPVADAFATFGDPEVLAVPLFALTWALRCRRAWFQSLVLLVPAVLMAMSQARTEISPQLLAWAVERFPC